MARYFFDTRDNDVLIEDEDGIEFADHEAAQIAAATSLAELAWDVLQGSEKRNLAVEVRDDQGPVMTATMTYEATVWRTG